MKLNSKGTTKLYNRTWEWFNSTDEVRNEGFKYDQIEFEADDFVDCHFNRTDKMVCLTLEEAKNFENMVLRMMFKYPESVNVDMAKMMKELDKKIQEVEKLE